MYMSDFNPSAIGSVIGGFNRSVMLVINLRGYLSPTCCFKQTSNYVYSKLSPFYYKKKLVITIAGT